MRIKRVVIHGFKTFARKTEFIFDPGVTAVVGPNGSGKSNIVDAVRWCLGEQSFSLLRSKKTSDVIFSGSDKKARLGMAEVRITLDNSAGEIPIDFAEVEISRRAYRDGDNEYLVNGQRVRLQDVVELLAQTGLGKRTYSVVGQGLIDRALSMAPEERRSLFEEAAGITGYQAKRATSLRRLEVTEQNLTRVRDIVAELSPRLGYMRRQADRAREREQLARDLQALLREWYGFRWHTTLRNLESHHAEEQAAKAAAICPPGAAGGVHGADRRIAPPPVRAAQPTGRSPRQRQPTPPPGRKRWPRAGCHPGAPAADPGAAGRRRTGACTAARPVGDTGRSFPRTSGCRRRAGG
jgi:chromosome segregation protein